ncbi:MAG: hypothetical protein CBD32_05455 [Actinobacteria bacterium TMED172]|nr:hypothetical protein [Acidimicrobiaceae bacterium]OUW32767.1 MAG: hypothetical protein CBD32_05455 [Actinobacteria bacterium TMED172]HAA65655.1 hypothetical protein [Acidimicrobiaceae bacterium]HBV24316.1 hypothetical protein [Acidimicrobiaceae bacterium]
MSDPACNHRFMRIPGPNELTSNVQVELLRRSIAMDRPGAAVTLALRLTREEALLMLDGYLRHADAA